MDLLLYSPSASFTPMLVLHDVDVRRPGAPGPLAVWARRATAPGFRTPDGLGWDTTEMLGGWWPIGDLIAVPW